MKQCYVYKDYCPNLKTRHSIKIWYESFYMENELGYKKMEYQCDHIEECPYPDKDEYGRCPLYVKAPHEPK